MKCSDYTLAPPVKLVFLFSLFSKKCLRATGHGLVRYAEAFIFFKGMYVEKVDTDGAS